MELLRLSRAARRLAVHPVTLRTWADNGKIPVTWVGRERRFSSGDVGALKAPSGGAPGRPRLEGLYVRVSGLREDRPGLEKLLAAAADGQVTVVRVTHEDRLARFGAGRLLAAYGATVQVLHPKAQGGREELLEDFISLVTTFAGRRRLLAESGTAPSGGSR